MPERRASPGLTERADGPTDNSPVLWHWVGRETGRAPPGRQNLPRRIMRCGRSGSVQPFCRQVGLEISGRRWAFGISRRLFALESRALTFCVVLCHVPPGLKDESRPCAVLAMRRGVSVFHPSTDQIT
jgi:hypothetical protein